MREVADLRLQERDELRADLELARRDRDDLRAEVARLLAKLASIREALR